MMSVNGWDSGRVDWNAHAFAEPEEVRLFASADTAEAFARATSPQPPERGVVDITVRSKLLRKQCWPEAAPSRGL